MDLMDQLQSLGKLIEKHSSDITTHEATGNIFVLPFIQALGYDIFDPQEVLPQFTPDDGFRNDETVDYAVMRDDKPALLFECKTCGTDLDVVQATQLRRCFHVASARIGILTNGISYFFYADLEEKNIMDDAPFLKIDLRNLDTQTVADLQKLGKFCFELDQMLLVSSALKYVDAIKRLLLKELSSPSSTWIRFLAGQVYSGEKTEHILAQFTPIVDKAFKHFIDDRIHDRLKSAIKGQEKNVVKKSGKEDGIVQSPFHNIITDEEFEKYFIVDIT